MFSGMGGSTASAPAQDNDFAFLGGAPSSSVQPTKQDDLFGGSSSTTKDIFGGSSTAKPA